MKTKLAVALLAFGLVACGHTLMRGTVAMKVNDNVAHVCLGDNEVKKGDRVALYKNDCKPSARGRSARDLCQKVKIGEGTVSETLNEHYSEVEVDQGVQFQEGTLVEKL